DQHDLRRQQGLPGRRLAQHLGEDPGEDFQRIGVVQPEVVLGGGTGLGHRAILPQRHRNRRDARARWLESPHADGRKGEWMRAMRLPPLLGTLFALSLAVLLGWSFWRSAGWLQLCAGLALSLFGMQCLEEGLRQLAGGGLERLLARSTGTPVRGLLFGMGGTALLQSTTLVSLLTIAFIGSGLVQLAGGIAVILGANLGATSGIWLLALAGQDLSLSPLALPLLVFGVLGGFAGAKGKAAGRVVLGVAFIFLGIDQLKLGFDQFGAGLDLASVQGSGVAGTALFVLAGLAVTVVLQSSHATLMLTLAALG